MFQIDASFPEKWKETVLAHAFSVVEPFLLETGTSPSHLQLSSSTPVLNEGLWQEFWCEICQKTLKGENEWKVHGKSKGHKANLKRQKKEAENPHYPKKAKAEKGQ